MDRIINYIEEFKNIKQKSIKENIDDLWIYELANMYNLSKKIITVDNANEVCEYILACECNLPYRYILPVNTSFKYDPTYSYMNKNIDDFKDKYELLNFIVLASRNVIYNENTSLANIPNKEGFDKLDLSGKCQTCSNAVKLICDNLNIKNEIIRIDPGFDYNLNLMDGYGYHYFNILTIENDRYLLDLSYVQFFDINGCLLERNGIYQRFGSYPGIYMIMDERRCKLAQNLINNGWIELDENNMKDYFDGFSISTRNALYYERLERTIFSTNYTANDYESFIYGDDSQANYEDIKTLGTQKVFIKNPKIEFKTDISMFKC